MKKTRLNSMLFVIICSMFTFIAVTSIIVYGISLGSTVAIVTTIILGIILAVGCVELMVHCHNVVFEEILIFCMDCNGTFKESETKKQVEHTVYGSMYVSYRCPHCKASIIN